MFKFRYIKKVKQNYRLNNLWEKREIKIWKTKVCISTGILSSTKKSQENENMVFRFKNSFKNQILGNSIIASLRKKKGSGCTLYNKWLWIKSAYIYIFRVCRMQLFNWVIKFTLCIRWNEFLQLMKQGISTILW